MKTKILIIEDNYCKYFTTKHLLEAQFKLNVRVVGAESDSEVIDHTAQLEPDVIMYRPVGGAQELMQTMRRRNTNRRNSEVTILVTHEFSADGIKKVQDYVTARAAPKRLKLAKAA